MQGHGHTPFSDRELSITTLASDVEKVMDYLKIDSGRCSRFSMGGSVAYQFAVQSPKRLRKLVIISSTYKNQWLATHSKTVHLKILSLNFLTIHQLKPHTMQYHLIKQNGESS